MDKKVVSMILGLMCFLLTIGIFIQTKTVESSHTAVAKTSTEAEIRNNILRFQEKYDEAYSNLEKANKKLDDLIKNLSENDNTNLDYPSELKKVNALLGYTNLEGQGIIIKVEDGDLSTVKSSVANYWVHDGDLYKIVNLLKSGGAEAISINNERIVSSTSITCAGNIIMINGKRVGSPFIIKAIGLPEKLYGTVTVTDSYLKRMQAEGVKVEVVKKDKITDKITIEKYNGVHSFNYAKKAE